MTAEDAERALLAERILAEQEERRRLAELLHDGPVQQLAAISQMLDAGLADLRRGAAEDAADAVSRGLALARDAARDLKGLCDDLEPTVLREVGFAAAISALSRRVASRHEVEIDLRVEHADELGEHAATALYQILREALEQAVRRGTPSRSRSPCCRAKVVVRSSSSPTTALRSAAQRCSRRSPSAQRRSTAASAPRCATRAAPRSGSRYRPRRHIAR